MSEAASLWQFLPFGYLLTVAVELPILWRGLSRRHTPRDRIVAGFWLTAVTYPIVVVVMPLAFGPRTSRGVYLAVAETFAPLAECALFYFAFQRPIHIERRAAMRDFAAIIVANLSSFAAGEILWYWLGLTR